MIRTASAVLAFVLPVAAGISPLRGQESVDPRDRIPDFGTGNVVVPRTGDLKLILDPGDLRGGSRQVQDSRRPRVRIYDGAGTLVREVVQQSRIGGAVTVDLPVGRYLVNVVAPRSSGRSTFWVTVRENRSTIVDPTKAEDREREERPPVVQP